LSIFGVLEYFRVFLGFFLAFLGVFVYFWVVLGGIGVLWCFWCFWVFLDVLGCFRVFLSVFRWYWMLLVFFVVFENCQKWPKSSFWVFSIVLYSSVNKQTKVKHILKKKLGTIVRSLK